MPIKFRCPNPECKKPLVVKDDLAGKRAACPACKKPLKIPAPAANAADLEALAMAALSEASKPAAEVVAPKFIKMECPMCMEAVEFPAAEAGKRAPCPLCKNLIKVDNLKEEKPKDWRQVGSDGKPTGAKRENQEPEGAWGTNVSRGRVSREALEEAGAIPEQVVPVTVATWVKRGLIAASGLVVLVVGILFISSSISRGRQNQALTAALAFVEKDGKPIPTYPNHMAAPLYRSIGAVYLRDTPRRVDKAQEYLAKARARLMSLPTDAKTSTVERDALLIEIALLQIDLGGDEAKVIDKTHLEWVAVLNGEVSASFRAVTSPEAKITGIRTIAARLDELDPGSAKPLIVASKALDAGPVGANAPKRRPLEAAALVALHLARKEMENAAKYLEAPTGKDLKDRTTRLAYAEGHARQGSFAEAASIAKTPGGQPAEVFEALLTVAAVAYQQKDLDAKKYLDEALANEQGKKDAKLSPWVHLQLVRLLLLEPAHADKAREMANGLKDTGARSRAQLEVLLNDLRKMEKNREQATPSMASAIDKDSMSFGIALEAIAQQNARQVSRSAALEPVDSLEERFRPFLYSGVALAGQSQEK